MRLSHPSTQPTVENFFFQRKFHGKLPHLAHQAISSRSHQTLSLTAAPARGAAAPSSCCSERHAEEDKKLCHVQGQGRYKRRRDQPGPTHPSVHSPAHSPKAELLPLSQDIVCFFFFSFFVVCLSPAAGKGKEGELELLGEEEEEEEEEEDGREQPKMGPYSVAEVIVYPVKACRGISVSSAAISTTGFLYDREWMVVNADNGRLIAMARAPKLALVQPSLPAAAFKGDLLPDDAVLEINAPGMLPLKVPLKRSSMTGKAKEGNRGSIVDVVVFSWSGQGVDEGPDAATWWSTYLGCNARLVRFDSAALREDRQAELAPNGYTTGFANTGQFLCISEASLEEVNTHFPNAPLAMNRFRPNIIVHGPSAFEEDKWHTFTITHNYGTTLKFHYVMPRALCKVPTINMEQPDGTGEEPLKTIGTFRSGKHLGLNIGNGKQTYFGSYFVCSSTLNKKSMFHRALCVAPGDTLDVLEMA